VTLVLFLAAPLGWPLAIAALGHLALVAAFRLPVRALRADLSYGTYIYGWPVAQTVAHLAPGLPAPVLVVASLAAVLPLAWASWHLVEAPALRRAVRV
jgi:peptidoglycan/LPS O-acetylase OafA/YrhL